MLGVTRPTMLKEFSKGNLWVCLLRLVNQKELSVYDKQPHV